MKRRATLYDWPKISLNFINQTTRYIKSPVLTYWKASPALCVDHWRFATSYDWSTGLLAFVEISPFARFQPFNLPDIALLKKIYRHENEIICQIFIILIDIEFITETMKIKTIIKEGIHVAFIAGLSHLRSLGSFWLSIKPKFRKKERKINKSSRGCKPARRKLQFLSGNFSFSSSRMWKLTELFR